MTIRKKRNTFHVSKKSFYQLGEKHLIVRLLGLPFKNFKRGVYRVNGGMIGMI